MKPYKKLLLVLSITVVSITQAQNKKNDTTKVDKNNYLDMGGKHPNQYFW